MNHEKEHKEQMKKPVVLVVDDTPDNLLLMNQLLKDSYTVRVANGGERALALAAADTQPDLILLDVMMPDMDGYEVCRRLKANPALAGIPVIFLTAKSEADDERTGLELGAVDYIAKPISPAIVLARVKTHLALKASADFLRDKADYLEAEVRKRTREVETIQDVTIVAMASLAETRDSDTGNHIRRTQAYVGALAEKLCNHPRFAHYLSAGQVRLLYKSAALHDIGKVGIPDRVLLKPGRLEPGEFELIKQHCRIGHDVIESAERSAGESLGSHIKFLRTAREIALTHHEKWDGSGYPEGLAGDAIPISARLMALADVYDALISRRIYKDAMPHAQAAAIIGESRGTHFDPDVVDAFFAIEDEFQAIARRYADTDDTLEKKRAALADPLATTLPQ
ncbi:MAG: two-component system response regulator [Azospira sp.]|jgi:putative two-component system response regulator|nr:two-component system response regulator [Azospira sp.]